MKCKPQVSIVVPTSLERRAYLQTLLRSLEDATGGLGVEVLIVFDPEYPLPQIRLPHISVRVFNSRSPGASAARNQALRHSQGEIVCFLDDDVVVERTYFRKLLPRFAGDIVGALGKIWIASDEFSGLSLETLWSMRAAGAFADGGASGANMSFKRSILQIEGGFDENLDPYSFSEDLDLVIRINKVGRVVRALDCEVIHFKAGKGGVSERKLSLPHYMYYAARNDLYVYGKNFGAKGIILVLRKTLKRYMNLTRQGIATVSEVPRLFLSDSLRGFLAGLVMIAHRNDYKRIVPESMMLLHGTSDRRRYGD